MINLVRYLTFVFWFVSLCFLSGRYACAFDFIEDFTDTQYKTSPYWSEYLNSGQIYQQVTSINFSSLVANKFPVLIGNFNTFVNDYSKFEIRFKYNSNNVTQGSGIVFSHNIPTNGDLINPNINRNMAIWVWPRPNGELMLNTNMCSESVVSCSGNVWTVFNIPNDHQYHTIKLERNILQYRAYIDGILRFTSQINSGKDIKYVWFGNTETTNTSQVWPIFEIDYVKIFNANDTNKTPVIIIPGLGASWDLAAILSAHDGTNWKIPGFVHVYDNLINSLKENGYEEDKDLFMFAYDWRKGINDLGSDLDEYIQSLITAGKIKPEDKINLIGHSMGGLVARAYTQNIGGERVNKIITAGSPHLGSVNAYGLWEGGEIWGWPWWQRAVMELIIQLNKGFGEVNVDTIRRITPSVRDLLPLWDYLKDNNNQSLVEANMSQRNIYLRILNQNASLFDKKIFTWRGQGNQTREYLKVGQRNWLDRLLNKWEDGKPIESLFSNNGDGTVIGVSALGGFSQNGSIETDHLGTINSQGSVERILEELALDKNKTVATISADNRDKVLVVALRSPGRLVVCKESVCDSYLGISYPLEKVFFLPDYNNEELRIQVVENGDGLGNYELHIGRMGENLSEWQEYQGKIEETGEVDEYSVEVVNNMMKISGDQDLDLENVGVAMEKLESLLPGWDKWKYGKTILDPLAKTDKKIRQIELMRLELSKIIIQSQKQKRNDITKATIDLWDSLDRLMEELLVDKNTVKQKQYTLALAAAEMYQGMVSKQLEKTNNLYAGILYQMANDLIGQSKRVSANQANLALDKLVSASSLLTTALLIR